MRRLIPLLIVLVGLAAGIGAGLALRPAAPEEALADSCSCDCAAEGAAAPATPEAPSQVEGDTDFVKMNNQFVIPVVHESRIAALVVLSLSLEVPAGGSEAVYQREPKLRDMFLQALFDHANAGGFDGAFTAGPNMRTLRTALREVAQGVLGSDVRDVLITDIARQDI